MPDAVITSPDAATTHHMARGLRKKLAITWAVLACVVVAAVWQVQMRLVAQEERHWSQELELAALRHAQAADDLSHKQLNWLEQLAGNVSVQLYVSQVQALSKALNETPENPMPERQYLENLLIVTAAKAGFQSPVLASGAVNATVENPLRAGMALLAANGAVIAATRAMPPIAETLADFLAQAPATQASVSAPILVRDNVYALYMQAPIFAVQSEAAPENRIGRVVGVRLLDAPLLKPVLAADLDKVETYLVPHAGTDVSLLHLSKAGIEVAQLPRTAHVSVEQRVLQQPDQWLQGLNRAGKPAYAIAHRVPNSTMLILQTIPRADALADVRTQLGWMWLVVGLGLLGVAIALWALVRHSAALRAAMSADHFKQIAQSLETQTNLLHLVTQNTPNIITIVDEQGRLCFSNRATDGSLSALQGQPMAVLYGSDVAKRQWPLCEEALDRRAQVVAEDARETARGQRFYQSVYIPLASIPVDLPFLKPTSRGVLIVEEDVTDLVAERQRQERTLSRVVDCLVGLVDSRDPFAAHHSRMVAELARKVAEAMQLSDVLQETAELAGKLLNVGKMHVPEAVLAQASALDEGALAAIREALRSSADVVEGIAFRGPVADTLRQALERADGSGIMGLRGEAILPPARIVAVVNAYVGMVSARAYRAPINPHDAMAQLMQQAGKAYDPAAVAALVHVLNLSDVSSQNSPSSLDKD